MAIQDKRKQEDVEIDMTPMLDIVFIMLIFFIVTTVFVKQSGVEVVKPLAETAEERKNAYIFVAIDDKNVITIDKTTIQPSEVKSKIQSMRTENLEGEVVIQADKKAKAGLVLQVLDFAKSSGAKVSVATEKEQ
ncbi:ExbD/TolR family protein [Kangiella spongicola]|jgi:biopolymer transport protein ExbD|uniref:Biopolymer transporter ExbD n=1 Tax=Kangiella spongicola TaxID=796379 RepID=A0A318D448_9GAMM|nr:biopolymer transporter ExbD [Kangiella spongicola]MBV34476.1 biopolymer transporter ExbD [Rickettsiales bacterium]PXF63721.1 biopolymer transporter ExbD [Kangiella spongicola]